MLVVVLSILFGSSIQITLDPQTVQLLNTILNILSPLLIAYVAVRVSRVGKKVEDVKENTKQLSEWDGTERREDQE